jgi:amicyanin
VPSIPTVKITTSPTEDTGDAITIKGLEFNPAILTVKVGTTVTWTNMDAVPHTVTSKTPSPEAFNSGMLQQGQNFSHTFTQWGTYSYFCTVHTYMSGKVIVEL